MVVNLYFAEVLVVAAQGRWHVGGKVDSALVVFQIKVEAVLVKVVIGGDLPVNTYILRIDYLNFQLIRLLNREEFGCHLRAR